MYVRVCVCVRIYHGPMCVSFLYTMAEGWKGKGIYICKRVHQSLCSLSLAQGRLA